MGPCVIALWAHPDIGPAAFYVMVDPAPGGKIPPDLKLEIGVQPVSGRLPEKRYKFWLDSDRGHVQYQTEVQFDRGEFWRVHLLLDSSAGHAEASTTVEATPTGLGRWDLIWYASPFVGIGFLWIRALLEKRKRVRA
jgi:hypothetical protein